MATPQIPAGWTSGWRESPIQRYDTVSPRLARLRRGHYAMNIWAATPTSDPVHYGLSSQTYFRRTSGVRRALCRLRHQPPCSDSYLPLSDSFSYRRSVRRPVVVAAAPTPWSRPARTTRHRLVRMVRCACSGHRSDSARWRSRIVKRTGSITVRRSTARFDEPGSDDRQQAAIRAAGVH
jgi:hypothetical protein